MKLYFVIFTLLSTSILLGQIDYFEYSEFHISEKYLDTMCINSTHNIPDFLTGNIYIEYTFNKECEIRDVRIQRVQLKNEHVEIVYRKVFLKEEEMPSVYKLFEPIMLSAEYEKVKEGIGDKELLYTSILKTELLICNSPK